MRYFSSNMGLPVQRIRNAGVVKKKKKKNKTKQNKTKHSLLASGYRNELSSLPRRIKLRDL